MAIPGYLRQLLIILLALILPSAMLVAFGVLFIQQERELALSRAEDTRAAGARDLGEQLAARLAELAVTPENLALRYPTGGPLIYLGREEDGAILPPWAPVGIGEGAISSNFRRRLLPAERLEFRDRNYARAARAYERLAEASDAPAEATLARLRAARNHLRSGDAGRGADLLRLVLDAPSEVIDEQTIPLAYYGADLVLTSGLDSLESAAVNRLVADLSKPEWISPPQARMVRLVLADRDSPESALVARGVEEVLEAERLHDDLRAIMRSSIPGRWTSYGSLGWLIGVSQADGDSRSVFAVHRDSLLSVLPKSERFGVLSIDARPAGGYSLRPRFPDMFALYAPVTLSRAPRAFLILGLAVLLGLTLFGGYLLWRDVRRETRLARLRAQFVSSVSHELRTPLTSIRMFADTLIASDDTPAEDRKRYLGVIANESERLTRMLNNVLNASRIDQGTMNYHIETGDVRDAIQSGVDAMQYAFDQQGVALDVSLPDEPVLAPIDQDAIEQAILNLLSNALKYGGNSPIAVRLSREGDAQCVIQVADSGPGISAKDQERIFERFFRSESAQNQRVAGAGLGLALVSHIVEAHGGRITLDSSPGQGSTFSIELPLSES